MKNINAVIRFIITAILGLWAFIATAALEVPPADSGAARETALKKAVHGFRQVSATSIREVGGLPLYVEVWGTSAEDVLKNLFAKAIQYRLDNPEDTVVGQLWLHDESDNTLFYGTAEYTKNAFEAGGTPPQYSIWIQRVPILQDVRSAEILAIGDDGKTANRQRLEVDKDGHVLFPSYLAGAVNGLLVSVLNDGRVVTYRLSDSAVYATPTFGEKHAQWNIAGHHVFGLSKDELVIVDVLELWENPTILVTIRAGQTIRLDVKGVVQIDGVVSIERPANLIFSREGESEESSTPGISTDSYTDIPSLRAGTYRIRFPATEWKQFAQPTTLYTGPIDNDGNGKGSETNPSK